MYNNDLRYGYRLHGVPCAVQLLRRALIYRQGLLCVLHAAEHTHRVHWKRQETMSTPWEKQEGGLATQWRVHALPSAVEKRRTQRCKPGVWLRLALAVACMRGLKT